MKSRNLSLQLLILVLTLLSIVQTTAQTLDATFTSPATTQCAGSLFTLNASTSGYQSYNWTITGSNNFSNNLSGASVSLNLPISDIYNVSLTVTDGVTTETNTLSGFLTVKPTPIINPIPDQIKCSGMYSDAVNFIGNIPNATYTWSRTNTDISASPLYTSGLGNIPTFLTNNPTITQVSSVFTVTPSFEGCIGSPINFTITVNPPPVSTISTTSVCVGGTVTTTPNTGGTWASTNAVAATITNSGIVSVGNPSTTQQVTIRFTETTSGCFSDHLLTVNPRPTVSAPASFCVGSTAQLSPSTGGTWTSSNLTIASINANSGLATGISPGNVTFTFTNTVTGCSNTTTNVTINALPTVSMSSSTICVNGTVQLSPNSGGTWITNNPSIASLTSTGLVTGLAQGTATFTFTNATTGCSKTTQNLNVGIGTNPVTISGFTRTENSGTLNDGTICPGASVEISATVSAPGGTYLWSNGSTASSITVSPAITSSYTLSYTNGCATNNSTQITVLSIPNPSYTTQVSNFCSTPVTNTFTNTSTNAGGGVSWTFQGGTPSSSTANTPSITYNTSGSFSVSMTATSAAGCTRTTVFPNAITVGSGTPPTSLFTNTTPLTQCYSTIVAPANALADNNFCFQYTGTGADTIQINWGDGSAMELLNEAEAFCHSYGTTGTFTIFVTPYTIVNNQLGCAGSSTTFIVTVNGQAVSMPYSSLCLNSTMQLSPSTGGTWVSNNSSVASITNDGLVTGLTTGTVNFTFTNSTTGCIATTSNLTVNSTSTIDPIPNQIVCAGDLVSTITFSGSAQQYNWTNDNVSIGLVASGTGNIASFIATNPTASDIVSTVTVSATGCSNTSNSFTITVKPTPTISPTSDQTVCHNDFTQGVTFTSSNPNAIYEWQNNNSSIGLLQYGTGPIPSFQALNTTAIPQVATFIVVPTLNGCPGTADTFLITVNPASTIDPTPNQIVCTGDLVSAITFSGSAQQYNWTNDNVSIGLGASGTGNIASFIATNPTANDIISTVTVSATGCSNTSNSFTITVKPTPTVYPSPDLTRCHNDSTIAINFSGAINGVDYSWTNDNVTIGCAASGTGNIPAFQVQNASTATQVANFVVTPILNGCVGSTINFDITVLPLPIVNAGNDTTICLGESYTPIVTGSGLTFTWNNGVFYNTPFTPSSTNTYTVIGSNNICNNSDSVTVTVNPIPQLTISTFDGEDSLACDGTLSVTVVSGTAPYTYAWTNGSGNFTTPIIENLCSGIYNLTVIDVNGCLVSNSGVINDTLIPTLTGDTLIFTDNIYQDSTIIGSDTSAWIDNCTFDYNLVTGATIDSYVDSGDSTFVTWIISLSDGTSIPVVASYFLSPGTAGVYELTLQLTCSQKSGPKFLISTSRIYYEGSTIGIEDLSSSLVLLFPNPATSTISIVGATETFQYEIRDIQGKLVKQGATEKEIDIASLTTGTYLISISSDEKMKQLRFVKL